MYGRSDDNNVIYDPWLGKSFTALTGMLSDLVLELNNFTLTGLEQWYDEVAKINTRYSCRMNGFTHMLNRLYIVLLLLASPASLFRKINRLPWYGQTLRDWVGQLPFQSHDRILELGCATGELTEYMAAQGYCVTGVDASRRMIRAVKQPGALAEYQLADALALPFADDSFDGVISASLLNVVNDPLALLREMARVCKPGGHVSVLVPDQAFDGATLPALANQHDLHGFSRAALLTWYRLARRMDRRDVSAMFDKVGVGPLTTQQYLHGMVFSLSATRPQKP